MTNEAPEDFRSVLYSVDRKGHRRWLYVDIVKGAWRRRRQVLAFFLIAFYLAVPFLTINGNPFIRIDIPSRTYILFGQVFWPQDFAYALLFVLLFLLGTLLMVSLLGRVFCGWFCPHNVFMEMVFRPIERFFEGPAHRHRRNDEKKTGDNRFMRKFLKNITYLIIAGALANAATALFVGTESFIGGVILDPFEHPYAAIFFVVFYFINVFNFVWFREQTCTLVCPYGRLQTAMLDRDTLVVSYNKERGEPRGKPGSTEGDCIDCERCIQVCPTGIDIRNGNQLECLHCAACIDACNDVMSRIERAPNLIAYASEAALAGEKQRFIRPRTIMYSCLVSILCVVTVALVLQRDLVQIIKLRQRAPSQLVQVDDVKWVQSSVPLSMVNKSTEQKSLRITLPDGVSGEVITQYNPLSIEPSQRVEPIIYVRLPLSSFSTFTLETDLNIYYDDALQKTIPLRLRRPAVDGG